jgi:nitrogen fixation-related uncharacterized protein
MSPERKKILLILVAVAIFDLLTAAGVYLWWRSRQEQARFPDEKERAELSVKMNALGWAVDGYLSRQADTAAGSDMEILRQAAAHDPSLLAENMFAPYLLKVRRQPHAVLLLCTKDGSRAVMEDAGCSARLDRQVRDNAPCAFTLRVSEGCKVEL